MSAADTRARLEAAVLDTLRADGFAKLSARTIARRADVNQALIFYHYDGVAQLLDIAARASVDTAAKRYRPLFDAAATFGQLLDVGRALHEQERALGNVAVMAQLTAAAQADPTAAATARGCLERWRAAVQPAVDRVLGDSPLAGLVDSHGLTVAISAGFLGLELYEGIDAVTAQNALDSLDQLGSVLEAVGDLGPVARRAVRARLRRRTHRPG